MKRKLFVLLVIVGLVGVVLLSGFRGVVASQRPVPPTIQEFGVPNPIGGEPAECAGQPGCGVMCYYIDEGSNVFDYELSCIAFIYNITGTVGVHPEERFLPLISDDS